MNKDTVRTQSSMSKNSVTLMFRMLLRLIISLYTTRIILNALGVDDYGIYNVIAGFTAMFSFVNTSMSTAISRFLAYDLGKDGILQKLEETFRLAFSAQLLLAITVFVLAEIIGIPIINYYLTIPENKLLAANILYQCTIISLVIQILQVPFNATIIATENMNIYAYIEIAYVSLLLLIAFVLQILKGSLLIYYGVMLLGINICIFFLYYIYTRKFKICKPKTLFIWARMKPMIEFSGADLYSNASLALQGQGQNIIINKFFGIVANASVGIASQIYGALLMFSASITTALRPRIIKLYAAKDFPAFTNLIISGSRIISYFNILLCIPLIFCLKWVLPLWLKEIPEYALLFAQILLLNHCLFSYKPILISGIHASGNIKTFSFLSGSWYFFSIGIQYLFAVLGFEVGIIYALNIFITSVNILIIVIYIRQLVNISIRKVFVSVILPNLVVTLALVILGHILLRYNQTLVEEISKFVLFYLFCIIISTVVVLNKYTRNLIFKYVINLFIRLKK